MKIATQSLVRGLERYYAATESDPEFAEVLASHPPHDETDLAYLIEFDGRVRMDMGYPVTLRRYLSAVADLAEREVALDAALDVSLRAMSGAGVPTREAVEQLKRAFPELGGAIEDAAALAREVGSTASVRERAGLVERPLPADFGPPTAEGVARYELRQLLGRGSMGEVYLASDRQMADHAGDPRPSDRAREALVAVKVLGPGRTAAQRRRLAEEATKSRRIDHPNVARVLDRGTTAEGEDYVVYEYVDGGDLERWLEAKPLVDARARALLVAKIARGVEAAHRAGVYHCDLKPANILMTESGEPKVTDFGIALRQGEGFERMAELGSGPVGNMAFMAPEQYRREAGSATPATDVYALGGILYYILSGRQPNGETPAEIRARHRSEDRPARAPVLGNGGPDAVEIDRICARAMEPTAPKRYSSAGDLAEDLEAWAGSRPIAWMRPSPVRCARLWVRRRPVIAALSAGLALAVLSGGGAAWYWQIRAASNQAQAAASNNRLSAGKSVMRDLYRGMAKLKDQQVNRDALPQVLAAEALSGSSVTGVLEGKPKSRRDRIYLVRKLLVEAGARDGLREVEVLLWESALGAWLLDDDKPAEALAVLESHLPRMEATLRDDPLAEQSRLLHAAAVVLSGGTGEALERARAVLAGAEAHLSQLRTAEMIVDQVERACERAGVPCKLPEGVRLYPRATASGPPATPAAASPGRR